MRNEAFGSRFFVYAADASLVWTPSASFSAPTSASCKMHFFR